jgi:hypothetical protein
MENKHHYRKVFKSDHLGIADLEEFLEEGRKLIFTIKEVRQEYNITVAGKKGNFNVAYFVEKIKPLVLNATNSKTVKSFCDGSPFVEDWKNVLVELYIDDSVKMKGEIVGGVRIKPIQPRKTKPFFTEDRFEKAKANNATIDKIKEIYQVTAEIEEKYKAYATTV